ncbi:Uncharacterised protein [uncultured archaeon]|nr:Uncharacterised protein [uncultured archaeon]
MKRGKSVCIFLVLVLFNVVFVSSITINNNFDTGIDSNLWTVSPDASSVSGGVKITHPIDGITRGITSKFVMNGDFDLQVSYSSISIGGQGCGSGSSSSIGMSVSGAGISASIEKYVDSSQRSGEAFIARINNNVASYSSNFFSSGIFRIKRTGSTLTVYQSDGVTIAGSSSPVSTSDITITFYGSGSCVGSGIFDNFAVNYQCAPSCSGKQCGSNGCNGFCGNVGGGCDSGQSCNFATGQCSLSPSSITTYCRANTNGNNPPFNLVDGTWFNYGDSDQNDYTADPSDSFFGAVCRNKLDTFCVNTDVTYDIKNFHSCDTYGGVEYGANIGNLPLCKEWDNSLFNGQRGFWDQDGGNDFSVVCRNNKMVGFCVDADITRYSGNLGLNYGMYTCDNFAGAVDFASLPEPGDAPYCKYRGGANFDGTWYYRSMTGYYDFAVVCRGGKLSTICAVDTVPYRGANPGVYDCGDTITPPPSCNAATCASLGKSCGTWTDGCGGTLPCGPACPNVCVSGNIALGKSVTTSPVGSGSPSLITNGLFDEIWNSLQSADSSATINLGGNYDISKYSIACGGSKGNFGVVHFQNSAGTDIRTSSYSCSGTSWVNESFTTPIVGVSKIYAFINGGWDWRNLMEIQAFESSCKGKVCGDDGCGNPNGCGTCSPGYNCNPANGQCVLSCTNDCTTSGQKRCSGNNVETCGNYDADSCLEWGASSPCSSPSQPICSLGVCVRCNSNTDCGTDGLIGNPFCKTDGNLYRNYTTFTCNNAGTSSSTCTNTTTENKITDCIAAGTNCDPVTNSCVGCASLVSSSADSYAFNSTGSAYNVKCNYGSRINCINAGNGCTFVNWIGNTANFSCPAGNILTNKSNNCSLVLPPDPIVANASCCLSKFGTQSISSSTLSTLIIECNSNPQCALRYGTCSQCNSTGACVPLPATTVCRADGNSICGKNETCNGASMACPADLNSTTTICRPKDSVNSCDVQEICDGTSNSTCPLDIGINTCNPLVSDGCCPGVCSHSGATADIDCPFVACTTAADCSGLTTTDPCKQPNCVSNNCVIANKPDNTPCPDDACSTGKKCLSGVCSGGIVRSPLPAACSEGSQLGFFSIINFMEVIVIIAAVYYIYIRSKNKKKHIKSRKTINSKRRK